MEEILQIAYTEKSTGNDQFRQNQYSEACKSYSKALLAVNQIFKQAPEMQEDSIHRISHEVQVPCLLNLALCYLRLGTDVKNAVVHCTSVIDIDPGNVKAYYRRAQAYLLLQEFSNTRADLISGLNLDPGNSNLKSCWQDLLDKEELYNAKSKRIAKAAFQEHSDNKGSVKTELLWGLFRCCRRRMQETSLTR